MRSMHTDQCKYYRERMINNDVRVDLHESPEELKLIWKVQNGSVWFCLPQAHNMNKIISKTETSYNITRRNSLLTSHCHWGKALPRQADISRLDIVPLSPVQTSLSLFLDLHLHPGRGEATSHPKRWRCSQLGLAHPSQLIIQGWKFPDSSEQGE